MKSSPLTVFSCQVRFGDCTESWSPISSVTRLTPVQYQEEEEEIDSQPFYGYAAGAFYGSQAEEEPTPPPPRLEDQRLPQTQPENHDRGDDDDNAPLRSLKAKKKKRAKPFASPKPPPSSSSSASRSAPSAPRVPRVPPTPSEPSPQVLEARKELPYDFGGLEWYGNHMRNEQGRYCYCGESGDWYRRMLQCGQCLQWFHQVTRT